MARTGRESSVMSPFKQRPTRRMGYSIFHLSYARWVFLCAWVFRVAECVSRPFSHARSVRRQRARVGTTVYNRTCGNARPDPIFAIFATYLGSEKLLLADDELQYAESLRSLLEKPIDVLSLLTMWQKGRLKSAGIVSIEDLHNKTEEGLIESIYGVGPVRARVMKNAADAELLEYISG